MTKTAINTAMILAAGLGKRLRPITDTIPKPMVLVDGQPMLDRALDAAERSGVTKAVVNIHYLGQQIIDHLADRYSPEIVISDERGEILETAGGVIKALPDLGDGPFLILNADTFWIEDGNAEPVIDVMLDAYDPERCDILLLLCGHDNATGHSGVTDYTLDADGITIDEAKPDHDDGYIYAGAAIIHPRIFDGVALEPHSLYRHFETARHAGRLHGSVLKGAHWYTISTPDSLVDAEAHIASRK